MHYFVYIATYLGKMLVSKEEKEKLNSHVGGVNNAHNQAVKRSEDLMKGLAFRSHDESQGSSDKENFLELLQFLEDHNESIIEVLQKALNLVTVVGGSCKRLDAFRDAQFAKIKEELENGVHRSAQGLNQETNLKRPGDTCWGSYYGTILNLILMFSAFVDVLEIIEEDGLSDQKVEA
nr:uncharacterized protein LOC111984045 [Quercus suber]